MNPRTEAAPALPLREPLLRSIQRALSAHERRTVDIPRRRQAAVLLPLFERNEEPWLVLTKRTDRVRSHKGEIAFPGGARDPEDPDLWSTAVRETYEEIGVEPARVQQLGALDDLPTFGSGFIVAPFVAAIDPPLQWTTSEDEIEYVIELPLRALIAAHKIEVWEREGIKYPMHQFLVDGHLVWGLTAFILRRFLDAAGPALEGG